MPTDLEMEIFDRLVEELLAPGDAGSAAANSGPDAAGQETGKGDDTPTA